ncbi:unnamed protein product [Absidia cylindrospora]
MPTNADAVLDTSLPALISANEFILTAMHQDLGLPWWASIMMGTLALRTSLTLPVAVYQQRAIAKMINLAPMIQSWAETLKVSVAKDSNRTRPDFEGYQKELNKQYRRKVNQIYSQHGCSQWQLLSLPWIQLPLFMCMTLSIRDLAALPLPWWGQFHTEPVHGLAQGGFSMWSDLTVVDPTMVFPFLVGAGNLINIELNAWAARGQEKTTPQKFITNGLRCLSVAFVPIAAHAPMALCLYWCTSSWYSVVQNLAFKIPTVRQTLGMPTIKAKKSLQQDTVSST